MKYCQSILLLPCHSLEDFPLHHEGDEAQGLLANWSALWHPTLIAGTGSLPSWARVDDAHQELADRLILVPSVGAADLPVGFSQRVEEEGACLIREQFERQEILRQAFARLDGGEGGVDQALVADFLALGYCYLQVELLTRQMRYASNLDEVHFSKQVLQAAEAAVRGDGDGCREQLCCCFDMLAEERDHYYPVDAFLVDLVVVAETTLGPALAEELARPAPLNLLMSAGVAAKMATSDPQSTAALKSALESDRVTLVGGEVQERRLPLLSAESILGELRRGQQIYAERFGRPAAVFGRRRFGLTPLLPQVVHKLGFAGALHATLDEGRFPEGMQIKTRWEAPDGTAIDALARAPLDASRPETYLNLAVKMGESMDMDHVATVCLAHWPGQTNPWLEDLRRVAHYTSALGKFVTLEQYFRETDDPGHADRFTADQYQAPYYRQALATAQADPISASVRYWRRRATLEAIQSLNCLVSLVTGDDPSVALPVEEVDAAAEGARAADSPQLEQQLATSLDEALQRFAAAMGSRPAEPVPGCLAINPCSFVQRMAVELSELPGPPAVEKPVYAVGQSSERQQAVVDVPPMGFVWLTAADKPPARRRREPPAMAEDRRQKDQSYALRNEFFEILIDPDSGALRSLYSYDKRGNRLSQQLAYRFAAGGRTAGQGAAQTEYSTMVADQIELTRGAAAVGEIRVTGRLVDKDGQPLAGFQQHYSLARGSRLLKLKVHIEPRLEPAGDAYFAARFAWADEAADLWRSVNGVRQPVSAKRFEAPQYIEIEETAREQRTAILTGGLPFHRRCADRMLDCLLIVPGESAREFEIGIGVDLSRTLQHAVAMLTPPTAVSLRSPGPAGAASGWLFHLDAKNVLATHWEPLLAEGTVIGFRTRLLETAGRSCRVKLSCFRPIGAARQVDFQGNSLGEFPIEQGQVRCELSCGEWIELECQWEAKDQG